MLKFFLPLLIVLAGCVTVTPRAALEALRTNPLEIQPQHVIGGIGLPKQLVLQDGAATMYAKFTEDGADNAKVNRIFELQPLAASSLVRRPNALSGETISLGRLSSKDARELRSILDQIKAYRATGRKGQAELGVGVNYQKICKRGTVPADAQIRLFMRLRKDAAVIPATRSSSLNDFLEDTLDGKNYDFADCR